MQSCVYKKIDKKLIKPSAKNGIEALKTKSIAQKNLDVFNYAIIQREKFDLQLVVNETR